MRIAVLRGAPGAARFHLAKTMPTMPAPSPSSPPGAAAQAAVPPLLRQFADRRSGTLSYLVACPVRRVALLLDPVAADAPLYLGVAEEAGWRIEAVLETHRHSDHASAAALLREATGALILAGRDSGLAADRLLDDGEALTLGFLRPRVAHTPGHTRGCLSLALGERWFTGDCLTLGDGGPTDEPDSDPATLYDTVRRVFVPLPDETLLYPGHLRGPRRVGCIGEERGRNPLFSGLSRDEFVARRRAGRLLPDDPGAAPSLRFPLSLSPRTDP
ncbi:MAG: MBL fold metallo-hydrolase [Azonexus sp.]|nr:MBL fold metallo-hydrolase [Betaproteobacteria bacterium]MBK8918906.1 MBL fold metallo-hydrolase [Betaproteobacteria bacterium]MBP6037660.1 MBL fold metallo-hydrolase [Azonexus sp.]MBP6908166.1 MBL fold metallo-hydrolase [Azonexus sp.]